MIIRVCKTSELSENDWIYLVDEFNNSFDRNVVIKDLLTNYTQSIYGYSYHAIAMTDHGEFCGHTSVMPCNYIVNGLRVKIGLSGGTFVVKKFRSDIYIFKKMYESLKERCREEGFIGIVGVPNENSFQYTLKILKKKHLRNLDYYVLPTALFKNYIILNRLYYGLIKMYTLFYKNLSNYVNIKEKKKPVEIEKSDNFLKARLGSKYTRLRNDKIESAYRVYPENGKSVAYIMLFQEDGRKSFRSLAHLVHHIVIKDKPDYIIFVGILNNFMQPILIKIPARFYPKTLPLTITIFDNVTEDVKQLLLASENWDFSLINFDVR